MKKKLMLVFSVMVVGILMSATHAFALTEGDWEFQLLDNKVTITAYVGTDTDIVVPDTLAGTPVTAVKTLNLKNLDVISITFPSSVRSIDAIFYSGRDTLETVVLPERLTTLAPAIFSKCTALKNVTLPSSLAVINERAFEYCTSLTKIELPAGIMEIADNAFYGCTALEEINLSECFNLMSIGGNVFFGCTSLKAVDLSTCSMLTSIGRNLFIECSSLTSIKFPTDIKEIPTLICWGCTSLKNVEMPNTVTKISQMAFAGCTALDRIILPSSIKEIDQGAFGYCNSLLEVVIPYGTESISLDAFAECENLQALYVPDTVTFLHSRAIRESNNCVIYCTKGSEAASVCAKNSISYLTDNSVNSLITVLYNGKRVSFHAYNQNPEIVNDRTLVPLRAIFEAMKAEVEWDQETQTVTATRGNVTVKITIGDSKLYKNGKEIAVDVPAQLINDRTMVPARVIAEAFGANVEWNNNGRTVLITE